MKRPRKIEFEFPGFSENSSYVYWDLYVDALEKYIDHLEKKKTLK